MGSEFGGLKYLYYMQSKMANKKKEMSAKHSYTSLITWKYILCYFAYNGMLYVFVDFV